MADNVAPSPWFRGLATWGLALLLTANLALLLIVLAQVWQDSWKPPLLIVNTARDLQTIFDIYKDRVDNLQKLITVLVGLASLYSIVLGITAYLSAQKYVADFGKAIDDANAQTKVLRRQLPILRGIDRSLRESLDRISKQLPDTEYLSEAYLKLTDDQREELLHYERSMAFLEFLDPGSKNAHIVSNLYPKRGTLCRVRYQTEKARLESGGRRFLRDNPPESWQPEERDLYSLIDRAKLYANRSLMHNPGNFGTLTDLAVIEWELSYRKARPEPFDWIRESLRVQPHQQRAYYWLGLFHLRRGKESEKRSEIAVAKTEYTAAVQSFSDALAQNIWEVEAAPKLRNDILYNRACALSRLAKLEENPARQNEFGRSAWNDLEQACPEPDKSFGDNLREDISDGDLTWLNRRQPAAISALQSRLAGVTPPNPIAVSWD
ncbi:MAG: hypothetical protein ABSH09_14975 [Bryobacteraceae bacterium]|jgi:hypothetical protein